MNRELYTWDEFEKDCARIASWARDQKFKGVFGVPRGGLVPAVRLSHLLDIPLVLNPIDITRDTLVVDDIIDSGATVSRLNLSPGVRLASLYFHDGASAKPDFFARKKTKWVLFPWETEETSRYDGTVIE